jgi:hypothetical protein
MAKLIEGTTKPGAPLATEACLPSTHSVRGRRSAARLTVTDGPFTESKEMVGGFAVGARSKEEAIRPH